VRRDHVRRLPDELTAQCFITTDLDDNQITAFHAGAMDRSHEARLADVGEPFSLAIVAPNGKRAMQEYARELKARGVPTVIDPGQGIPLFEGPELLELLEGAAVYIVNDYEWSLTLDRTGLSEAGLCGRVEVVVVTRGEAGSTIRHGEAEIQVPAVRAERVVDPTGCGDAYRAGFLYARVRELPLETCGRLGSVLGSLAVEQQGTQSPHFDLATARARFRREFGADF
jgi:adenosine kinase